MHLRNRRTIVLTAIILKGFYHSRTLRMTRVCPCNVDNDVRKIATSRLFLVYDRRHANQIGVLVHEAQLSFMTTIGVGIDLHHPSVVGIRVF